MTGRESKPGLMIGEKPVELIAAEQRADEIVRKFMGGGREVIDGLKTEVGEMRIADRFSREAKPADIIDKEHHGLSVAARINLEEEGEVGLKRAELLREVRAIENEAGALMHRLHDLILNIEATKKDF